MSRRRAVIAVIALVGCTNDVVDPCDDIARDDCLDCCDAMEPNGHACHASDLGGFTDSPDTNVVIDGLTLRATDEDWYQLRVTDETDLGGSPWITISASGAGADVMSLSGWFDCNSGADRHQCVVGIVDDTMGRGCRALDPTTGFRLDPECTGTSDEDGRLLVRVQSTAAVGATDCDDYQLQVEVR